MALSSVTVNQNNLVLTNGQIYQNGNTVYLSDDQFSELSPALFTGGSPVLTLNGQDNSSTPTITINHNNVVLTNGQLYQSGATVLLSDSQYCELSAKSVTDGVITL